MAVSHRSDRDDGKEETETAENDEYEPPHERATSDCRLAPSGAPEIRHLELVNTEWRPKPANPDADSRHADHDCEAGDERERHSVGELRRLLAVERGLQAVALVAKTGQFVRDSTRGETVTLRLGEFVPGNS